MQVGHIGLIVKLQCSSEVHFFWGVGVQGLRVLGEGFGGIGVEGLGGSGLGFGL